MATAWHIEDWGETLGTTGVAGWSRYINESLWPSGTAYWGSVGTYILGAVNGTSANIGGTALKSCGSQWHVIGQTTNTASLAGQVYTLIGTSDGTKLYAMHGYQYSGTGTSVLGFYRDDGMGGIGTGTQDFAKQHWTSFNVRMRGTLSVLHGSQGTWAITWEAPRGGSTGSHTLVYAAGAGYAPLATDFYPVLGFYRSSSSTVPQIDYSKWESSADDPPSILYYTGTWGADGGSSGTYQWGSAVIGNPSPVADRAMSAGDTGGWANSVTVTLSDADGAWTAFAGSTLAVCEGTWTLQKYWAVPIGSWVPLLRGFVEPANITYDYSARTVTLRIDSAIARIAQRTAPWDGTSGAGDDVITSQIGCNGTIAGLNGGTVYMYVPYRWGLETGCYLWSQVGTNGLSVRIGSSITTAGAASGTGTFVLDDVPDWLGVGNSVYYSAPWPSWFLRGPSGVAARAIERVGDVLYTMGLGSFGNLYGMSTGEYIRMSKEMGYSPVSPNYRAYGGEKLSDILRTLMDAVDGMYTVDPTGAFRCRCTIPFSGSSGTIDFSSAYDSQWTANYTVPWRSVTLRCHRNAETGSYQSVVHAGGTTGYGQDKTFDMPWIGSDVQAQSAVNRLFSMHNTPRGRLVLRLPGSAWVDYLPGDTYEVTNLPSHLGSLLGTAPYMTVQARIYDYASDLTALELISRPDVGQYAYWDVSPADVWDGGGKVWF